MLSLLLSFNLMVYLLLGKKARGVGWWWERKVSGSADSGFTDRMSLSLSKLSTVPKSRFFHWKAVAVLDNVGYTVRYHLFLRCPTLKLTYMAPPPTAER